LWKGTPEKTLRVIRFWEDMTDCEITMREIHSSNNLILSVKPR
jgi:spermidine synthase